MEWWLLVCVAFLWPAQITATIQTTEEVPSTHVPRIVSTNQTAVVRRGEEALFDCEVDELGAFAQIWRKNNDTYFVRNIRLVNDSRISLGDSYSLQIINVKAEDAGVYVCQISSSPSLELRHELKVVVAPTVTTVPPDGKVDVGIGQSLAIGCRATGVPEPSLTWTLPEGVRLENAPEGNELKIPAAEEKHAGTYRCTASNGYDPPVSKTIRVVVHHAPVVRVPESVIYTGEGATVELLCQVYGRPAPEVTWLDNNGTVIYSTEHHPIRSTEHTHRLQIRKIRIGDLGDYTCRAENDLGTATQKIQLSGLANPVEFRDDFQDRRADSFTLRWSVKSHSPVIEFLLKFRKRNTENGLKEDWLEVRIPGERRRSLVQSHSYEITGLEASAVYEALILTRNEFGWSGSGQAFLFATLGASVDDIKEESVGGPPEADTTTFFPLEYAEREATPFPESAEGKVNGAPARRIGNWVFWLVALLPRAF